MTTTYVDHLQQKTADICAGCRYEFELSRAFDFARDGRSPFTVGAVGRAVSG
jgi:hypothetical protein